MHRDVISLSHLQTGGDRTLQTVRSPCVCPGPSNPTLYLLPSREQVPLERLPLDKLSQLMEPLGYGLYDLTLVHRTLRDFDPIY
jgi:hypothetical protein